MPSNEDLYREMAEQEEEEDQRYKQLLAQSQIRRVQPNDPDYRKAQERYEREIRPVLETRARIIDGKPATGNPVRNAWLRITGQDKIVPPEKIVEPSKGLVLEGPSIAEVQKEIAANPDKFRHLTRKAPDVRPTEAKRKAPQDFHR